MSVSIDERTVRLNFDNSNFEANVKGTMSTLDKLKSYMKDLANTKGGMLGDMISKSVKGADLSPLSNGVDTVKTKFSALEIAGMTAINNITNRAVDAGLRIAKSLTIEPVTSGLEEYELQLNSTQTIMANTGASVEETNAALDELNEYADLTIYNFSQMTHNVGLFTAAMGQGSLANATKAMKGIGNWAAYAGTNATDMARATMQLSQALPTGYIRLMDWRSVVTAGGMAGKNFQDAFIEEARKLGTGVDEAIAKEGSFQDSLKHGWFTNEVFFNTMERFANDPAMTDAATKVKTFTQMMDTLKEAAGSGWALTWRYIFGDFEQAKATFTDLTNFLTEHLFEIDEARNKVLEGWSKAGGRDVLIKSFKEIGRIIGSVGSVVRGSFIEVFGELNSNSLLRGTERIRDFFAGISIPEEVLDAIGEFFTFLFETFSAIVTDVIPNLVSGFMNLGRVAVQALDPVANLFEEMFLHDGGGAIVELSKQFSELTSEIQVSEEAHRLLNDAAEILFKIFKNLAEIVPVVLKAMFNLADAVSQVAAPIVEAIEDVLLMNDENGFMEIAKGFETITDRIQVSAKAQESLYNITARLMKLLSKVGDILLWIADCIGKIVTSSGVQTALTGLLGLVDFVTGTIEQIVTKFSGSTLATAAENIGAGLNKILTAFGDGFILGVQYVLPLIRDGIFKLADFIGATLKTAIDDITIGDVLKVAWSVKFMDLAGNVAAFFGEVWESIENFTENIRNPAFVESVTGGFAALLSSVGISVESFMEMVDITAVVEMAAAFALMAWAIDRFAQTGNVIQQAANIGGVVAAFKFLMHEFQLLWEAVTKRPWLLVMSPMFLAIGLALMAMAEAVNIMVRALQGIAEIKSYKVRIVGSITLTLMLNSLVRAFNKISDVKLTRAVGKALLIIVLAKAVGLMVDALVVIGHEKMGTIGKGLLGVLGLLGIIDIMVIAISKIDKKGLRGGKVMSALILMIGMAAALRLLMSSFSILANMDNKQLAKGLGGVTILMVEMTALVFVLSKIKVTGIAKSIVAAVALAALAVSLSIAIAPLALLGNLPFETAQKGILAFAELIAIMSVAIVALGSIRVTMYLKAALGIAALALLAIDMNILAVAMKGFADAFRGMDEGRIATIVLMVTAFAAGMAGVVLLLGAGGFKFALPAIFAAGAMLMIAISLQKVAKAMIVFSKMSLEDGLKAAANMISALTAIAFGAADFLIALPGLIAFVQIADNLGKIVDAIKAFEGIDPVSSVIIGDTLSSIGWALKSFWFDGKASETMAGTADGLKNLADAIIPYSSIPDLSKVGGSINALLNGIGMGLTEFWFKGGAAETLKTVSKPLGDLYDSISKWTEIPTIGLGFGAQLKTLAEGLALLGDTLLGGTNIAGGAENLAKVAKPLGDLKESLMLWVGWKMPVDLPAQLESLADVISRFGAVVSGYGNTGVGGAGIFADGLDKLNPALRNFADINVDPDKLFNTLLSLAEGLNSFAAASLGMVSIKYFSGTIVTLAQDIASIDWSKFSVPDNFVDQCGRIARGMAWFTIDAIGGLSLDIGGSALKKMLKFLTETDLTLIKVPDGFVDTCKSIAQGANALSDAGLVTMFFNADKFKSMIKCAADMTTAFSEIKKIDKSWVSGFKDALKALESIQFDSSNLNVVSADVSSALNDVTKSVSSSMSAVGTDMSKGIADAMGTVTKSINGSSRDVYNAAANLGKKIGEGIKSSKNKIGTEAQQATNVSGKIRNHYKSFYDAGAYLAQGFKNGMGSERANIIAKARNMANEALNAFHSVYKFGSPSRTMIQRGKWVAQGFANGMTSQSGVVKAAAFNSAIGAKSGLQKAIDQVQTVADKRFAIRPVVKPVVDLTEIQNGANIMSDVFANSQAVIDTTALVSNMANQSRRNDPMAPVVKALGSLHEDITEMSKPTYNINGITYDDGSNLTDAVRTLINAARVERRR